jgi:CheY-like chemotaxis protein
MKEVKQVKTKLKTIVPDAMVQSAIEVSQGNPDDGRISMSSVKETVKLSTFATKSTERSVPRAPRCHSWADSPPLACRNILLVEYRDEVFARLAADLTDVGLRVERAVCMASALKAHVRLPADLLLVNVDLPDGSGWLLSAKLRRVSITPHIWLYTPWPLPDAVAMAEYVGADGLIAYDGDLCRLSAGIVSRVSVLPAAQLVA